MIRSFMAYSELFRAAVEAAGEAIVITSTDLEAPGPVIEYVNPAFTRMTGYRLQEVLGRTPRMLQGPKTDRAVLDRLKAELKANGTFSGETVNYRKDGSAYVIQLVITPMRDDAGRFIHWLAVQRDVTRKRHIEIALAENEAWLRQALDIGLMGVWDANLQTGEMRWSEGIYAALGYGQDEIRPDFDTFLSHAHPEDRTGIEAVLRQSLGQRQVFAHTLRFIRRDGSIGWCEARALYEYAADGRAARIIGVVADITKRRDTEQRLQELQRELIHASRLSAVGTMASTLAHEINQPLTAVTSYVETARQMLAAPDRETLDVVATALDKAASEAVRAGQIVHRLRDFVSRGETDKRIEFLPEVIDEAAALALSGGKEKAVQIIRKFDHRSPLVLADRVQIQQVLVNLIRNAVEAMASCWRRQLTICSRRRSDGMVEVSIADTGTGVAPEIVEQLFQPFVSTKREGMGLGLSISRTIVEAHGGRMWAEPNKGGGAVFRFTLPQADPEADDG